MTDPIKIPQLGEQRLNSIQTNDNAIFSLPSNAAADPSYGTWYRVDFLGDIVVAQNNMLICTAWRRR
jgi:hypothetical protein